MSVLVTGDLNFIENPYQSHHPSNASTFTVPSVVVVFNQAGFGYSDLSASFRNSLVTLMVDIYPALKKSVAVAAWRHIRES